MKLPEGATLIPGVIGHCTDFIEHPDLVAERLVRYAGLVGRENVLAGTDCGLGTRGRPPIDMLGEVCGNGRGGTTRDKDALGAHPRLARLRVVEFGRQSVLRLHATSTRTGQACMTGSNSVVARPMEG